MLFRKKAWLRPAARKRRAMRATRSSVKEWPLRDGPRPAGVGGSGARRVVGEKSRASISRQRLAAHVCVTRVFVYVHAWKMVEERRAAGDNDGNRRDRYALAREKDRGETGSDG